MIYIGIQIIFWIAVLLLLHNYLLYPLIMKIWAKNKKINQFTFTKNELPKVAIVIAAFNEEKVIQEKLERSLKTNYPKDLYHIFVGSDNSTDTTNAIVQSFAKKYPEQITFKNFEERAGKQEVLNKLFKSFISVEKYDICIMTDANILFEENTIGELAKHFKNEKIGIVCANIKNFNVSNKGISKQEQFYISAENQLKINEGKVFGASMAAFGACYAIRRNLVPSIPPNILMEDFYISMSVLEKNHTVITEPKAICYEDLPQAIEEEFKRKKRISTGNFQNLAIFKKMLYTKGFGIGFSFFSHKVLRWIGFLLLLTAYACLWYLKAFSFYLTLFYAAHILIGLAIIDYILTAVNINVPLLRFLRYFLAMNTALLVGFFHYAKGVKTNIWQPTKRNE